MNLSQNRKRAKALLDSAIRWTSARFRIDQPFPRTASRISTERRETIFRPGRIRAAIRIHWIPRVFLWCGETSTGT